MRALVQAEAPPRSECIVKFVIVHERHGGCRGCYLARHGGRASSLFYELLGSGAVLMGGCDDWKKAYRQIPTSDPSRSVVALWDPDSKQVVYFVVWGHCFGQLSAVNSFNAVSKFLTCMSRMLFGHAGGNYFDDHFTVEPDYMEGSGQKCLNCLAEHLGFLFDPAKHVPMAPSFVYLGVNHDLSASKDGKVLLRILPKPTE